MTTPPNDLPPIDSVGTAFNFKRYTALDTTTHYVYKMWRNSANNWRTTSPVTYNTIKVSKTDSTDWSDNDTTDTNPTIVDTTTFTGKVSLIASNEVYRFALPNPSWGSPGPTVTQTRTAHTGIIPNATVFTLRNPSPGNFYEKTGVGKFKVKFLDQNEPGSYNLRVTWTTLTGTISDIQTITQASGDIELEYTGTSPSNTPVYGPITLQVDQIITHNGQQYVANTDFKTLTYYETGPFTASFSPGSGIPGQLISYSVTDTNPYPDNDTTWSIDHPSFTNVANGTLSNANNYSSNTTNAFTSIEGTYTVTIESNVVTTANYSVTTASNGGGKPDRYPLIMTNLFNRNRSLYSIGMTHKDTWDLFL